MKMLTEETKQVIVDTNLKHIQECLNATVTTMSCLDHTGRTFKRIVIEWDVED